MTQASPESVGMPSPRARMDPAERREQILRCAEKLFEEQPFEVVSMDHVAEAAGVARPLIHHYFGTKRGLYLEVVKRLYSVPTAVPMQIHRDLGETADAIDDVIRRYLDGIAVHRNMWLATTTVAGPGSDPEIAEIMRTVDLEMAELLLVALGLDDHPDRHRLQLAFVAFGAMAKSAAREWLATDALTRADVHDLLTRTLSALLPE